MRKRIHALGVALIAVMMLVGCQETDAVAEKDVEDEPIYLTGDEDAETLHEASKELIHYLLDVSVKIQDQLAVLDRSFKDALIGYEEEGQFREEDIEEIDQEALKCSALHDELIGYTGSVTPDHRADLEKTESDIAQELFEACSYGVGLIHGSVETNEDSVMFYMEMMGDIQTRFYNQISNLEERAQELE